MLSLFHFLPLWDRTMITGLRNLKANAAMLLDRVELYSKLVAAETKIETSLIIRRLIWVGVGAV